MATDLTLTQQWLYNKNGRIRQMSGPPDQITISGSGVVENVQTIPDGGAALTMGSVTSPGFASFHNCSDTKYIRIGTKNGGDPFVGFLLIPPGNKATMFLDRVAITGFNVLYAIPEDTTSVALDYAISDA